MAAAAFCVLPNTSANSSGVTQVSPTHSISVRTSPAKNFAMPLVVSANHWVRRAKREVKKRLVKLSFSGYRKDR